MQSVNAKRKWRKGAAASRMPAQPIVLPRLLRKPVRHVLRLINHGIAFSPKSLTIAGVVIVAISAGAGLAQNGKLDDVLSRVSALAGFQVTSIDINGVNEVSRIEILTSIDTGADRSLLTFDAHKAREELKRIAWVRDVSVSKIYPDRVAVNITERQPFAVWQNGQALFLVERDGAEIAPYDDRFANLPLVVGKGAAPKAAEIMAEVARFPALSNEVKSYVRVGDRRWDLNLKSGQTIMLPENDPQTRLAEVMRLDEEQSLLERAIGTIDLRFAGRMYVKMDPRAAVIRSEAVAARISAAKKKKEKDI